MNNRGILRNFGTLNMGKATSADLYNQTLSYHIRGGLKGINLDVSGNLTNNLFSYRLDYEEGTSGLFDNNISKQSWRSNIDNVTRSNTFRYDGSSQLKASVFASTKTGENYGLNNVNYDGNGNILALSRSGATNNNFTAFGNVDNLVYTYQSNSNKLLKIADATTTNADLGDFRDGTNTDDDYEYWADGSLKRDKNKKISLTYNYLKRPETITFDNGRTIITEYDAEGTKLKKIDSNGETTDYEEDDIYVNNVLYQTSHDEGRINAKGEYEYNITDHNNDLRVAFRDSLGIAVPTQSIFYDSWGLSMKGMQITRNPLNFNKYQFLNRETQFETGYIDLIHRQYDPQTGRFTSLDPVIEGQEHLSLYQYSWNNPINKSDPNGDFCIPCATAVVGGIVGAGLNAYDQHKAGTLEFSAKSIGRIVTAGAVGAIAGSGLGGLGGAVAASTIGEAADQFIQTGEVGDKKKVIISGVAAALTGGLVKGAEAVAVKSGIVAIAKRTISSNSTTKIVTSAGKAALNSSSRKNVKSVEATTKSVVEGVSGVASYVGGNTAAKVLTPPTSAPVNQPTQPVPPANKPNEPPKPQ